MASLVTLTTDFGLKDPYVGMMKGVMLAISPHAQIVDLSHEVAPGDVEGAAFILGISYKYFPQDTVHVVVVDPGVGTDRNALCLKGMGQYFVGPDNGVFSHILDEASTSQWEPEGADVEEPCPRPLPNGFEGVALTKTEFWLREVSNTFHGRDVFAPVAANLPDVELTDMGDPVTSVLAFPSPQASIDEQGRILGKVLHVDRFGNLVTDIRAAQLPEGALRGRIEELPIGILARTFAEGEDLFPLVGSAGYVEIAERNGNAASRTGARVGSQVVLERTLF